MNKLSTSLASLVAITLSSFSLSAMAANPVATVNGKKITQKQYEMHLRQRSAQQQGGQKAPVNRQVVIDELINREVLLQEAKKLKIDKDKKFQEQLEIQRNTLLIQALLARSPVAQPVTEDEMKKVYDQQIGQADASEYKARHILVKDEAKAKDIIKQLNSGKDFAELAKTESTGPSGKDGGDLGWFSGTQMVPPFSQAVAKMKKGTHSQAPVKTRFGWHVIKLEDSRKRQLPSFEQVKNQIGPMIQNQRLQQYILKLRNSAKIEVK